MRLDVPLVCHLILTRVIYHENYLQFDYNMVSEDLETRTTEG